VIDDQVGGAALHPVAGADLGRGPAAVPEQGQQVEQDAVLTVLGEERRLRLHHIGQRVIGPHGRRIPLRDQLLHDPVHPAVPAGMGSEDRLGEQILGTLRRAEHVVRQVGHAA
jgi:hypothetical protein